MSFDGRTTFPLTALLLSIPACGGFDDPFDDGPIVPDKDAGSPQAQGGTRATPGHAGSSSSGRHGSTGGSNGDDGDDDGDEGDDDDDGDDGTSGTGTGGSDSMGGAGGGGAGVAGSGIANGGTTAGGAGGSCHHVEHDCGMAGAGIGGGSSGSGGSGGEGGSAGMAGSGAAGSGGTGGTPALTVRGMIFPFSCDHEHDFEIESVVDASGAPVVDFTCEWMFDDGGVSSECAGVYEFSNAGPHNATVLVRQRSTGASGTDETPTITVVDPIVLDVSAEAPSCGLSLSWVTVKTGGRRGGFTGVDIQPFDAVLTPPPWPASGTVDVSMPGTYEVNVSREEETTGPICNASATTTVTVTACP